MVNNKYTGMNFPSLLLISEVVAFAFRHANQDVACFLLNHLQLNFKFRVIVPCLEHKVGSM